VPNTVIKRDLQVLPVREEVRNYTVSPTDKGLTITPTAWQNLCLKEQITVVALTFWYRSFTFKF
jgi:hypothetical protein